MVRAAKKSSGEIRDILAKHPADRASLIPILQDIQEKVGYLSQEAVEELEELIDISANEIYGVATFYTQFRFTPSGEHNVQVCQGTACHVRRGYQILKEFERLLGIAHVGNAAFESQPPAIGLHTG